MFDRDYDSFLAVLIETAVENTNNEWEKVFDLEQYDSAFAFLKTMFVDFKITTLIQDEFVYIGFTYFLDNEPIEQ